MRTKTGRTRTPRSARTLRAAGTAALLLFSLAACKDFSFFTELGVKGGLSISPSEPVVVAGGSVAFTASGGVPGYTFSLVSGSGSILTSGLYTSAAIGKDYIRVRDSAGQEVVTSITVVAAAGSIPDYLVHSPVFPSTGVGGGAFTGSFIIQNAGQDGDEDVHWNVYVSADGTPGPGDVLADQGAWSTPIPAGGTSAGIGFSGTWPAATGHYHILIVLAASDEADSSNNRADSGEISVPGTLAPDYEVTSVTPTSATSAISSSNFGPYTFTFTNGGSGAGTVDATWEVYLSQDGTIGAGDRFVAAGIVAKSNLAVAQTNTPTFSGTWPSVAGPETWHLVARVSAADESGPLANSRASSPINVDLLDVDYSVDPGSITAAPTGVLGQSTGIQSFQIRNTGTATGTKAIQWEVYASPGNQMLGDAGDVLLASGSHTPVAPSTPQTQTYSGTWPATGAYYLVVRLSCTEDKTDPTIAASTGCTTVSAPPGPNYEITEVQTPADGLIGASFSSSFKIKNTGVGDGAYVIEYSLYASANADWDGGDWLIASGSRAKLNAGVEASQGYSGTWPTTPGQYYVIVRAQAVDDASGAAQGVSAAQAAVDAPPPPNYAASFVAGTVREYDKVDTAIYGSPKIRIQNTSPNGSSLPIQWAIYRSPDNLLDGSDQSVASGLFTPPPGPGASVDVGFAGDWNGVSSGYWFLIAVIGADDDSQANDNLAVSSAIAVAHDVYVESTENNDASGPSPNPAQTSNTGLVLPLDKTIAFRGTMDAWKKHDTFRFQAGAGVKALNITCRWATGKDDIDLYLWDDGTSDIDSIDTANDAEPAGDPLEIINLTAGNYYYASAYFWLAGNTSGSTGKPYTILIRGKP